VHRPADRKNPRKHTCYERLQRRGDVVAQKDHKRKEKGDVATRVGVGVVHLGILSTYNLKCVYWLVYVRFES